MDSTELAILFEKECESRGQELLEFVRQHYCGRESLYDALRVAVFRGCLTKAQLFFSYGSAANEFEAVIDRLANASERRVLEAADLGQIEGLNFREYPFNREDLEFYLECRECFSDFQTLVVLIERHLSAGTFLVMRQHYGVDWILAVDRMKRRSWAQVREDFRSSSTDMPLHEFSSIPDLRDIILSTQNWRHFNLHLPKVMAEKDSLKRIFNDVLIPSRNTVFHPTRASALKYSEYADLRSLRDRVHLRNWRDLENVGMTLLPGALPVPQTY